MKRIIQSLLLALVLVPMQAYAVTCCTTGGSITAPNVDKDSNSKLVLRTLLVDATGTVITPTASGQTQTVYSAVEASSYGYMTTTAGGTAPSGGSITAVAITGTVFTNITVAAGYNGPCQVCIYPGNGPGAAFYYLFNPASTWIAPSTPLAVSTTPVCKNMGVGSWLALSATAAAVTVNATVVYSPLK